MRCKLRTPVLEFIQWTGQGVEDLPDWVACGGVRVYTRFTGASPVLLLNDSAVYFDKSDQESVSLNNYIVRDQYGHAMGINRKYFESTYEVIPDEI